MKPGAHKIKKNKYKEWNDRTKTGGRTYALYLGNKLKYLDITMWPHKTTDMFYETFNHELIHAYDHVKYGLKASKSYRETKAYRYTDRYNDNSSMPTDIPVYNGNMSLWDLPTYLVPTKTPLIKSKISF